MAFCGSTGLAQRRGTPKFKRGRFLLFFALAALLQFALLLSPWFHPAIDGFSRSLVWASSVLINCLGGNASHQGAILRSPINGFAIEMRDGCNGINVTVLLWSAILAFPGPLSWKLMGILVGAVAIQGLNFFRFISLFYLGQYSLTCFEFAHLYLWETLVLLDALIVFGILVRWASTHSSAYVPK
jgi:exosortase H (IPTLxxWG-CTERM-specific)